jgi:hypothetical protein
MVTEDNHDEETRWTDDQIRDLANNSTNTATNDVEDQALFLDPFRDPDPTQTFSFQFQVNDTVLINIELKGYKKDSDPVWKSTGLTLWRASEHLCHYMLRNKRLLDDKQRIIEVSETIISCG